MRELNHASKTPLEEHHAKQRYAKAWHGSGLVEDKLIYWKEVGDVSNSSRLDDQRVLTYVCVYVVHVVRGPSCQKAVLLQRSDG